MQKLGHNPYYPNKHTYIIVYLSFSPDYNLISHATCVVCVNFILKWQELQFNIDSERQIF